jgi:hypothetical protein
MKQLSLSYSEAIECGMGGVLRAVHNVKDGHRDIFDDGKGEFNHQIEGNLSERVVAKLLDRYWHGKGERGGPDVGLDHTLQVRGTCREGNACLIVRKHDPTDATYYFAQREPWTFSYRIFGPIHGSAVKVDAWWNEETKAWWMPSRAIDAHVAQQAATA